METRKHIHEENFSVAAEKMFEILIIPSAIRKWWGASRAIVLAEKNGVWAAEWGEEDNPDYISAFTIAEYEPPKRILFNDSKYFSKDGALPFDANLTAEFIVEAKESGCSLKVIQDGFPCDDSADEFYAACEIGWRETFKGIREYFRAS